MTFLCCLCCCVSCIYCAQSDRSIVVGVIQLIPSIDGNQFLSIVLEKPSAIREVLHSYSCLPVKGHPILSYPRSTLNHVRSPKPQHHPAHHSTMEPGAARHVLGAQRGCLSTLQHRSAKGEAARRGAAVERRTVRDLSPPFSTLHIMAAACLLASTAATID